MQVDREEFLRYLGWKGQETDDTFAQKLDEAAKHALGTSEPRSAVRRFALTREFALAGTGFVLEGKDIIVGFNILLKRQEIDIRIPVVREHNGIAPVILLCYSPDMPVLGNIYTKADRIVLPDRQFRSLAGNFRFLASHNHQKCSSASRHFHKIKHSFHIFIIHSVTVIRLHESRPQSGFSRTARAAIVKGPAG